MRKLGILYICTGRYKIFWEDFYKSSEKYFLTNSNIEKHYFIFTDAKKIPFEKNKNVHKIYQEKLPWPYITLYRFKIFDRIQGQLEKMNYLYFFNANLLFVDNVGEEILPTEDKPLVMVKHPGYYNKSRREFPYESNRKSLAYIGPNEGSSYLWGGLNGGNAKEYLNLISILKKRIDLDIQKNIIAIWHDESHLNRYAIDVNHKVKILSPIYGYPEGWNLPFKAKIMVRDKNKYGGHSFLREKESRWRGIIRKMLSKLL